MDDSGGVRAKRAESVLTSNGFQSVVVVQGGANAWKSAWDATMRRRQLPGSFSRGFDNPMFADSNVVAEDFGASSDDTVWIVDDDC
jgi:3-mercaptopyruvate sulfurtransferase SseA